MKSYLPILCNFPGLLEIMPVDGLLIIVIVAALSSFIFVVLVTIDFLLRKHRNRKFARARGVIFILRGLEQCELSAHETLEVAKGLTKGNDCKVWLVRAKQR